MALTYKRNLQKKTYKKLFLYYGLNLFASLILFQNLKNGFQQLNFLGAQIKTFSDANNK